MTRQGKIDKRVRWCVTCGEVEPDGAEVCPVSDVWMRSMGATGLRHLIAYGTHARALDRFDEAYKWRVKAGVGDRMAPDAA